MRFHNQKRNEIEFRTVDDVEDGRIGEQLQLLEAELLQLGAIHFLSTKKRKKKKKRTNK
jgi:hypothetical protein